MTVTGSPRRRCFYEWLGGGNAEPLEVPADCTDLFLGALWARPELDAGREHSPIELWFRKAGLGE